MVRSFCTTNDVSSGVAIDTFDFFVNDDVSSNATMEAPDRTSTLSFLDLHEIAAVASSRLRPWW